MSGMKQLEKIIEELRMRVERLEAGSTTPTPPYQGGGPSEATDDDLIYTLRVHGEEAYRKALRVRNRQRQARDRHNAPLGNHKGLPLQKGEHNAPRPPFDLRGGEKQREAA